MQKLVEDLERTVRESYDRLLKVAEADGEKPLAPGKWSRKETMGHLIDSASNNHQRFVRAQLTEKLAWPGYKQDEWVRCQDYQHESWMDLLHLWKSYNLHLLHVVSRIPEDRLGSLCSVGGAEPVTLRFLAEDYVRHLKHHLGQILG